MPTVEPIEYEVRPSCYDQLPEEHRNTWNLYVFNGGAYGWSVRSYRGGQGYAMNKKGQFISESRGSLQNKTRRWSLDEATKLALRYVDEQKVMGMTAQGYVNDVNERMTENV